MTSQGQISETTRFHATRVLLGLLLLLAAALKIYGLIQGLTIFDSLVPTPAFQLALVEIEVLLGAWFLLSQSPQLVWLAGISFFAVLAVVNLGLAISGESSCGCFGPVTLHPWWTFGLDIGALIALSLWRPGPLSTSFNSVVNRRTIVFAASCGAILLLSGATLVAT